MFGVNSAMAVAPSAYNLTEVEETGNWNYYDTVNGTKTYYQITPKNGTHYNISSGGTDFSIKSIKPGTDSYSYYVTPQGASQARVGVGAFTGTIGSESEPVVFHGINVDPTDPDKGGAVYNYNNTEGHSIYADFVSNTTTNYGGGVRNGYNANATINKIVGNFLKNKAGTVGGAIANGADCDSTYTTVINEIIGNFIGNTAGGDGGGIYNQRTISEKITGDFLSNTSGANGGAIRNTDAGTIGNTTDSTSGILGNFVSNSSTNGGAISNEGTIYNIVGDFILNTAATNGGAINNKGSSSKITNIKGNFSHNSANGGGAIYNFDGGEISNIAGDFESNSATTNGGAISNFGGSSKIGNIAGNFKGNHTDTNSGAIHNGGTIENIIGDFENNSATNMGGAIVNGKTINKVTGNFTKNSAKNGGAVYNSKTINFVAENGKNITFNGNYVTDESGNGGAIFNATSGTVGLYASEGHSITFTGNAPTGVTAYNVDSIHNIGILNINGVGTITPYTGTVNLYSVSDAATAKGTTNIYGGTVNVKDTFTQKDLNLKAGTFNLGEGAKFSVKTLQLEGGTINFSTAAIDSTANLPINIFEMNGGLVNIADGSVNTLHIDTLKLEGDTNFAIDADLAGDGKMDKIQIHDVSGSTITEGKVINISKINLLSATTEDKVSLDLFADEATRTALKDNVSGELNGLKYSPIYIYDAKYSTADGEITFTRHNSGSSDDFNPYLYAPSSVAQTTANITTQIAGLAMDKLDIATRDETRGLSGGDMPKANNAWVKVMGFDDDVEMKHFNNIDSKTITLAGGFNTDKVKFDNFDAAFGIYAGYIGGKQKYNGNKIEQNGGYVGLSSELTKGNAFLLSTINGGFINNENKNMYGTDKFDTYWFGLGLKGGYNYALNDTWTLQPNIYAGYTLVSTEDYTSKSKVRVDTDDLNFFEIDPGFKLTKQIDNGWLGYIQGKYAIVMDNGGDTKATDVSLPDISHKNYFEYGFGMNKSLTNTWSLSGEINRRDGGRSGWNGSLEFKYSF